jgi:hypothetical protein
VPDVIVGALLGLPRLHRQRLLGPIQRLNLGLLIDAEHDRVLGRVQIQPDNVGDLGDQLGIGRELERFGPPRLHPVMPRLHNLGPGDRSRTGEPYLGATVEFSNLWGGNVHMNTDANGEYSLRAPADVYNAVALDLENMTVDVVGRSNNVVEVPQAPRRFRSLRTGSLRPGNRQPRQYTVSSTAVGRDSRSAFRGCSAGRVHPTVGCPPIYTTRRRWATFWTSAHLPEISC